MTYLECQRFPIAFQTFFAFILILMLMDLPESPRYLINTGRIDEARVVLAHLTSQTAKPTDSIVVAQSREIEQAIELERSINGSFKWKEMIEGGELQNGRRMALCFGIQLMQQMGGISKPLAAYSIILALIAFIDLITY